MCVICRLSDTIASIQYSRYAISILCGGNQKNRQQVCHAISMIPEEGLPRALFVFLVPNHLQLVWNANQTGQQEVSGEGRFVGSE